MLADINGLDGTPSAYCNKCNWERVPETDGIIATLANRRPHPLEVSPLVPLDVL